MRKKKQKTSYPSIEKRKGLMIGVYLSRTDRDRLELLVKESNMTISAVVRIALNGIRTLKTETTVTYESDKG